MRLLLAALTAALLIEPSLAIGQTGSFGAMEPAQGTAIGGQDPSGKLRPLKVDAAGNLMTSGGSTGWPMTAAPMGISAGFLPTAFWMQPSRSASGSFAQAW